MGQSARWVSPLVVAIFATTLAACADPQAMSEVKAKVDEMQAHQKDILTKLEGIEKGHKEILAKAPAAERPAAPQEDPNKVYTLTPGNSYAKGPANAPVTIVEFSDF